MKTSLRSIVVFMLGTLFILGLPWFLGKFGISLMNDIGIGALVALGLVLLTGVGGATSFGQAAFVGVAAYTTAYLTTHYGLSAWTGLIAAVLITALCALVIGCITLRLGGHFLPLSTIAWGLSISLLFGNMDMLGRNTGITNIPPVSLGSVELLNPLQMYYLIWLLVGLALLFSYYLLRSRAGRVIRSLRGGSILLASVGEDAFVIRLKLFISAAVFAALAGWLYAHMNRFVSPSPFDLHASINYLLMAILGGVGFLSGALVGAAGVLISKNYIQDILPLVSSRGGQLEAIVFSALFILLLHFARGGIMSFVARRKSMGQKVAQIDKKRYELSGEKPLTERAPIEAGTQVLSVDGVVRRFGGLVAVNNVSFTVSAGEIVGLIGPNGAGKSTMFNLITGVLGKTEGRIRFLGEDVTHKSQRQIARLGVARTFQHVKLRPAMSVLDSVALGANMRGSAGFLRSGLGLNRAEENRILDQAYKQLVRIGLDGKEYTPAGKLPLGLQRILEIARALASDPVLLILDEPAAGLRKHEKDVLATLLRQLKAEGLTILIVEHDMDFVMKLVDRLVVMNFGAKLIEGSPQQVRADKKVQDAYLGGADQ
ncbi:amino acid/amide ABC transporter membrane protein 2 (HAAT family) /amino acid/amide ABC transporter ATP-binding protein 1 (HAAT family) [Advenella incenata]|uniref:Amino acid/amide ABC transporter membrane protein 2 (HAAT family) /amino acid/amide ABC transporter ATP-binding protein 1 (HAAT family) n=1 Tax=Advenella incenata TaxID=267800 RepID=A0A4Q7VFS3_9BURK|nr:branched-chain amino acid ABC transporter ATP-binding protein/permease [Advenella incenata]RZT94778.1 amino acid/amide ABC transporter membrane protein 2 (HAAT family) /amino acid/amide ABC transporter ATP-binding protein 1 (HAAT family) [Advenella incenata]